MSDYFGKSTLEDWLAEEVFEIAHVNSRVVRLFEFWRDQIEDNITEWMESDDGHGNNLSWRDWGRGFNAIPQNEMEFFDACIKFGSTVLQEIENNVE